LNPGEGGSCRSKTKDDRRMAPKPELFVSKRRLQKQKPQPRKTALGSSPDEDGFSNLETKHEKRTMPRPKMFVSAGDYRNKGHNPKKLSCVPVPVKTFSVPWKLMTVEHR
jgi:hypothetical protein